MYEYGEIIGALPSARYLLQLHFEKDSTSDMLNHIHW